MRRVEAWGRSPDAAPLPGGGGTFGLTGLLSREGQRVILGHCSGTFQSNSGVIAKVVGVGESSPGGGAVASVSKGQVSGNSMSFLSEVGTRYGVFEAQAAGTPSLSLIADSTMNIPNGTGTFRLFSSQCNSNIAFIGQDQNLKRGVYARINGQLLNIADTLHPGPGGVQFMDLGTVAISGEAIAFTGSVVGGPPGLFVLRQGQLTRVVSGGDSLNGISVSGILLGPEGFKGDTIAFAFNDFGFPPVQTQGGVYTATYIPAPGWAAIAGCAAAMFGRCRRTAREPDRASTAGALRKIPDRSAFASRHGP